MVFDLKGKVALVTGGASGIGLRFVKELLKGGVKGVTLADVDPHFGVQALQELDKEFGKGRAIFVKTDVSVMDEFESAFKKTVEAFKFIDILINNAGILNDAIWQKEIAVNVNGVVHGMILGLDNYLSKYKQGDEAVILNLASTASVGIFGSTPIYCGTKAAVLAMSRSWGIPHHYDRSKVRVVAICPGATHTPLLNDLSGRNLGAPYQQWLKDNETGWPSQEPEFVAGEAIRVIKTKPNGTAWVIEGAQPAYEYIVPERETMLRS